MVKIVPTDQNGLNTPTEVNAGQLVTMDKARLGKRYGFISKNDMAKKDEKLAYMLNLTI